MLTDDGTAVLIDYGKAKEMHEGADGATYYKQRGEVAIPIRWYPIDPKRFFFLLHKLRVS